MNRFVLYVSILLMAIITFVGCKTQPETSKFITVENGKFIKNGQPYNYIGTNYWYGALLGADTIGGDRNRLHKELDFMKKNGIDNVRVLVGAEGPDHQPYRVTPALVKEPGVYSPKLLEGLDYFLNELQKRNMHAILFFTNNWEWSGGMAQYNNWNGLGDYVNPNLEEYTWPQFFEYQKQFYSCEPCMAQVNYYIETIVTRTNTVNGLKYTNDPAIMAWELANEPRPMADDNLEPFTKWVKETSELIKKLDSNHLVTTGSEGKAGCQESIELFETIHSLPSVDYATFHIWMKNWSWYDFEKPDSTFPLGLEKVQKYIDDHIEVVQRINKPLVLEEFGLARDHESFEPNSPTTFRNKYYDYAFGQIAQSIKEGKNLVGANFWAFGGFGAPVEPIEGEEYWKVGDPYSGDPPQEPQGLNSVYVTDTSTIEIIKKYNKQFGRID